MTTDRTSLTPTIKRTLAVLLGCSLLMAACGSSTSDATSADDAVDTTTVTVEPEAATEASLATDQDAVENEQLPAGADAPEGQGPPPGGEGGPEGQGPPPDAAAAGQATDDDTLLTTGPQNVGEHGPFSNADLNGDETVTRAELDEFMDGALEREIGLVAFFDLYDADGDDILDADELATVDPAYAFDGTDANADGLVSLDEVTDYANEEGRSYRAIGLGEFFDLVDTDGDNEVSPEEIEVAHESGLLARF